MIEVPLRGLGPFVTGSPGCGKSSIMKAIADKLSLSVIDHRLSTSEPTDMCLPNFTADGHAYFAPFAELFPLRSAPLPEGARTVG